MSAKRMTDEEVVAVGKKRKIWPLLLGTLIFALAIVGTVSIVNTVRAKIVEYREQREDTSAYARYLTWVVGVDPDPFTDITKADYDSLLNIAACSLLSDEVKTGQYQATEDGLVVPQGDVEAKFIEMFGTEVPILHKTVVGYGYEFSYSAQTKTYTVPLTGVAPPFVPRIESVSHTGGLVVLRVGYVSTSNVEVSPEGELEATQPDKYMDITLKQTEDGFNLVSLVTLTMGEYQ